VDHILLVGNSWTRLSAAHYRELIEENNCTLTLDSESLTQAASGLFTWAEREEEIRAAIESYPPTEQIYIIVTVGGLDAVNQVSPEVMQVNAEQILFYFLSYSNVDVLWLSYNDFPADHINDRLYTLYSILPETSFKERFEFLNLHNKIGPVTFVDMLHLHRDDYARRVGFVWKTRIRPHIICEDM
jgi:hypothetical protein